MVLASDLRSKWKTQHSIETNDDNTDDDDNADVRHHKRKRSTKVALEEKSNKKINWLRGAVMEYRQAVQTIVHLLPQKMQTRDIAVSLAERLEETYSLQDILDH